MNEVIITSVREELPGVKTFTVATKNGGQIPYEAGQFITLAFYHHGREERRSYSISSASALAEPLSFTVKRVDNGAYSRLLVDRAMPGDTLFTIGVSGLFTLPASVGNFRQVFFFAAGIGITPVFSLIKTLLAQHPGLAVTLIYSNSGRADAVFHDELVSLVSAHPGFSIEFLYSNAYNLQRARLNKELVPRLIDEFKRCPPEQMLFYICGPYSYMRMTIYALQEYGITDEQIRRENFNTNDRVVIKTQPPDKDVHQLTLHFAGERYSFPVQYPASILQAARKQGIALPFSCEVGRCGSCAALCISGQVWLSYNEVLMDNEVQKGKILTCVGYPIGGDVEIIA